MTTITFVQPDGNSTNVNAANGKTVKDAAVDNLISGIPAECGGACACATCHVYIGEQWRTVTGEPGDMEKDMLDFAQDVKDNSRLSCQVVVSDAMDGMIVHVPEDQ